MTLTFLLPPACRVTRSRLVDGIEGRLGLAGRLEVEDHLGRCRSCADELADLAATRHAVGRALAPYRLARARVAPGRARLGSAPTTTRAGALATAVLGVLRGPAKHGLAFSVLMFMMLATVDSTLPAGDGSSASTVTTQPRLLQTDEESRLVRFWHGPGARIPVGDNLVIEVASASEEQPVERVREGLVPPYLH
jgi:anti-sigma factor RsiW